MAEARRALLIPPPIVALNGDIVDRSHRGVDHRRHIRILCHRRDRRGVAVAIDGVDAPFVVHHIPTNRRIIDPEVLLFAGGHTPERSIRRRILRGYTVLVEQGLLRLGNVVARELFFIPQFLYDGFSGYEIIYGMAFALHRARFQTDLFPSHCPYY